eukprot:6990137-Alexandrium_andersonii.AAC.1
MASYHCVRAAGSQRAITEPVQLGAEWACCAPNGVSVAILLDRAVHFTGRAWGAEPAAWREREAVDEAFRRWLAAGAEQH